MDQQVVTTMETAIYWYTGGIATIVGGLAGWLGSLWRARILQREQAALTRQLNHEQQKERADHERALAQMQQEHDRQLSQLRQDNDIRLRSLEARLNSVTLVHRVRFEKEFQVYQQAWAAMTSLVSITLSFRPTTSIGPVILDEEERQRHQAQERQRKLRIYDEEERKVFAVFQEQKPFFDPAVFTALETCLREVRGEAVEVRLEQPGARRADYYERAAANCQRITEALENSCIAMRRRVEGMSVIDGPEVR